MMWWSAQAWFPCCVAWKLGLDLLGGRHLRQRSCQTLVLGVESPSPGSGSWPGDKKGGESDEESHFSCNRTFWLVQDGFPPRRPAGSYQDT